MSIHRAALTAIAVAAAISIGGVAAQAAPLLPVNLAAMKDAASPETVQVRWGVYRGGGWGYRGGGWRGGYAYRGIGYRGGYYRGFGYGRGYGYRPYYGLAAGALVGGAIASSAYYGSSYYGYSPYYGGGYNGGYGYGYGYGGGCDPYYGY
ncbi:hypothetical protein [Bradyrhizobium liaoningense]|uniref:hypothetical protein n=1 Tax=Bradyrhizobium liaoningense TaxID=43992 RepID=UPI001BAB1004|nr:hypothetical protein [Bradyrhizobium liaoningense]MBR0902298.1 hypothetical protein [Bradyrhizobium liaoningense]